MKIKDLINKLNEFDDNIEVFVYDEYGHERIDVKSM